VLVDLEEADIIAGGERSSPRGVLTISAPPILGEEVLRPVLDNFLQQHPSVSVRLLMLDRFVNLVDEGVDVALRIGNLTDSTHISTRIGGDVRRVVVASPEYLASHEAIQEPADLLRHDIIAFSNFGIESWSFNPTGAGTIPRTVHFSPRYVVNSVRAAAASAAGGMGVTRLYSYHVSELVREGALQPVLTEFEPPALPVHLLAPQGRTSVPKVRAFVDFAVPRLRSALSRIAVESGKLP
jgi:DNA-binding transcriptional LysR family regulator